MKVLTLEVKWIAVALVPLSIALVVEGYIEKFKGFGLEIVARLNEIPVSAIAVPNVQEVIVHREIAKKKDNNYLTEISKKGIEFLVFLEGKSDYYDVEIVENYLRRLGDIKYIEVQTLNGQFRYLLPIKLFFTSNKRLNVDKQVVEKFIDSLEKEEISVDLEREAIELSLCRTEPLIDALRKMRNDNLPAAVVVDKYNRSIGVLEAHQAERKIADAVLFLTASQR